MTKKTFLPEGISVVGPYSPAVEANGLIFFSGQIPIDSFTGKIVDGDIKVQAQQCLNNLSKLLEAVGVNSDNIVKSTVYLTDIKDFTAVNEVYGSFFKAPYPARTAIAVSALPLGANVEIEVIASK